MSQFDKSKNSALFEKFEQFIANIKPGEKLAVLFHKDGDGLCSALITSIALEKKINKKPNFAYSLDYHEFDKIIEKLKLNQVNKAIIVDMGVDGKKEIVEKLDACLDGLMVLDHHKVYQDMNSETITFIKSQFFSDLDGSKYPATKLCYDLFSQIIDIKEIRPIACIGLWADMGYEQWKPFFDETEKDLGLTKAVVKQLTELVGAVETIKPKEFNELYTHLMENRDPTKLMESRFAPCLETLQKELERLMAEFEETAERNKALDLIYFNLKSPYNIKSAIANKISVANPNKTVVILEGYGKRTHFSFRRQDFKVKMNDLIETAIKDLPDSSGGGHIPAAAGGIPSSHLNQFKERIEKYLQKL